MAVKVELSKDILKTLIEQGISLRNRQIKAATNALIKSALEEEIKGLTASSNSITEAK